MTNSTPPAVPTNTLPPAEPWETAALAEARARLAAYHRRCAPLPAGGGPVADAITSRLAELEARTYRPDAEEQRLIDEVARLELAGQAIRESYGPVREVDPLKGVP